MTKANYSLRLQPSLKEAAERIAAEEGASLNQFINVAVAEKLSAIETQAYFRRRAARGNRKAFLAFLDGAGDEEPVEDDRPDRPLTPR
ncbi:MAG: toxin-antitoxin system HicB family antitoxin [Caulobacteraceae bacterium]